MLLLRQGLWDRQEDCSALFPLDEKEWNEIHSMARKQTVQGIIYDGIRLLPTEAVPRCAADRWNGIEKAAS